jgi:hypothetical protein
MDLSNQSKARPVPAKLRRSACLCILTSFANETQTALDLDNGQDKNRRQDIWPGHPLESPAPMNLSGCDNKNRVVWLPSSFALEARSDLLDSQSLLDFLEGHALGFGDHRTA